MQNTREYIYQNESSLQEQQTSRYPRRKKRRLRKGIGLVMALSFWVESPGEALSE